ncbi:MAG: hypothetical protein HND47_25005 [Chloroflexi bacterium]|nr:hypothetical protein [Chloroflexota bacterium]
MGNAVISPSLQLTQMAPLVMVPAFIPALIAIWFGAKQIVQPLQKLESKWAGGAGMGDSEATRGSESVGGISEVQHLQMELTEMSRKVQAAQEGLHDYIGAIIRHRKRNVPDWRRELHDDTIQAVIALKQRVQLAQRSVKDQKWKTILHELGKSGGAYSRNLRRLTWAPLSHRPRKIWDRSLRWKCWRGRSAVLIPPIVDFQKTGNERRLSREVELHLYRIGAAEALNNVVKHSGATGADLSIRYSDSEITLMISDNGHGFVAPASPTEFVPNGHFGLLGIQ